MRTVCKNYPLNQPPFQFGVFPNCGRLSECSRFSFCGWFQAAGNGKTNCATSKPMPHTWRLSRWYADGRTNERAQT